MLVTRPSDSEHSHWSFGKYFPPSGKVPTSSRMSDPYDASTSAQPDWQGQYPYVPQPTGSVYTQPSGSNHASSGVFQPQPVVENGNLQLEAQTDRQPALPSDSRHHIYRLGAEDNTYPSRATESSERKDEARGLKAASLLLDESLAPGRDATRLPAPSNHISSARAVPKGLGNPSNTFGPDDQSMAVPNDDAEDALLDEDMAEEETDSLLQTTAERVAARRKMKRFRLTHQQTRFLTSEFAKQPHPDAAHRERLSREIPGLSPRQVQVWFQNRRAKIKRLNADDRDRMIKMRAVPDDFDNVQALHSPYGAVHGMPLPLAQQVDFPHAQYSNSTIMRPLMVDVRRGQDAPEHMSPTGLTPSFGSLGFHAPNAVNSSGVMSPISPHTTDRYPPHGSAGHHGSLEAHRHAIRPLQGFHGRDSTRPRSESLQSYYMYSGPNSHSNAADRPHMIYQSSQVNQTPSNAGGVDRSPYTSNSNAQPSPTALSYPNYQQTPENGSRLRAASASLPLNTTDQYRPLHSPQPNGHRSTGPSSQYGTSATYQSGYGAAPLTAPLTPSLAGPLSRASGGQPSARGYQDPTGTTEFSQTVPSGVNGQDTRTETRSMYTSGAADYADHQHRGYAAHRGEASPLDRPRPLSHQNTR
ncbi:hypothetical protein HDV63DRAFT_123907 [Trichoderma sp. SZMC 28014]